MTGTRTLRVLPLGDSITSAEDGWRRLLWDRVVATFGPAAVEFVGTQRDGVDQDADYDDAHEGHSGALVTDVAAAGLLTGWLRATDPDVVLMHFGTNDIWRGTRSQASVMAAFDTLLAAMRAHHPDITLLVARIAPMDPGSQPGCPPRVAALNTAIAAWAAANTTARSPVTAVDHWTGFSVADDTSDGVHPNETGNAKMAERWFAALADVLDPALIS
ncbi:SGNH/GDSL hydrolase family protein [Actinokineospora sp. 24-640]